MSLLNFSIVSGVGFINSDFSLFTCVCVVSPLLLPLGDVIDSALTSGSLLVDLGSI